MKYRGEFGQLLLHSGARIITFMVTIANKLNQTEVSVKRFESSEEGPAEFKGAELKQKREGFSQKDFRCVWSAHAQAHSSTLQKGRLGGEGLKKNNR